MYINYRYSELSAKSSDLGIIFDVMVTGVTGAGKSTTLNAFFQKDIAKVGRGVDPETMKIDSYKLNHSFRLWDTPGLGDGKKSDREHSKLLIDLLYKNYGENNGWIDLVLVIIEGSNRDMGTTYKLLNEIIIPNFPRERILVAVNQADVAMKGRYWDYTNSRPMKKLTNFLEDQVDSVQRRIHKETGIKIIRPAYYSAEYSYNIHNLFDLLIDNMPNERRKLPL